MQLWKPSIKCLSGQISQSCRHSIIVKANAVQSIFFCFTLKDYRSFIHLFVCCIPPEDNFKIGQTPKNRAKNTIGCLTVFKFICLHPQEARVLPRVPQSLVYDSDQNYKMKI